MKRKAVRKRSGPSTLHLSGRKYTLAYMLVAAGELGEDEIATLLGVELAALKHAISKRYFQQQVDSIRNSEAILRAHGMHFKPTGELALLQLEAFRNVP